MGVDDEEVVTLLPPPPPHAARVKIAANTAPILMGDFVMIIPFKWFFSQMDVNNSFIKRGIVTYFYKWTVRRGCEWGCRLLLRCSGTTG